jgi:hypothetical protein
MANGATAAPEISAPGLGEHPDTKTGFQKRIDKLTREKYELRQANDQLRKDNAAMMDVIERYEQTIRRYKTELIRRNKTACLKLNY